MMRAYMREYLSGGSSSGGSGGRDPQANLRTKIDTNFPMYVVHVEVVFSLLKRTRMRDQAYMRECTCILA